MFEFRFWMPVLSMRRWHVNGGRWSHCWNCIWLRFPSWNMRMVGLVSPAHRHLLFLQNIVFSTSVRLSKKCPYRFLIIHNTYYEKKLFSCKRFILILIQLNMLQRIYLFTSCNFEFWTKVFRTNSHCMGSIAHDDTKIQI